jgi:hypothetical protein
MKYELWHSESESSYDRFASGDKGNADMLPPDAHLIWTVEAESWDDACRKQHEFLGWEPYKPV